MNSSDAADSRAPRKPYRRPRLTIYGDLRQITQTTMAMGSSRDMTTGQMNKTG
jgi:hypothetical protein